jgi:hypothetical protein
MIFLPDFNKTFIFSTDFRKKALMSSVIKTHPMGAELFHAGRQTDTTKLIVTFNNFAIAPKKTGEGRGLLQIDMTHKRDIINIAEYLNTKYKEDQYVNIVQSHESNHPNTN